MMDEPRAMPQPKRSPRMPAAITYVAITGTIPIIFFFFCLRVDIFSKIKNKKFKNDRDGDTNEFCSPRQYVIYKGRN